MMVSARAVAHSAGWPSLARMKLFPRCFGQLQLRRGLNNPGAASNSDAIDPTAETGHPTCRKKILHDWEIRTAHEASAGFLQAARDRRAAPGSRTARPPRADDPFRAAACRKVPSESF